jgi:hypothetical protein
MKCFRKWSKPVGVLMAVVSVMLSLATPGAHAALVGTEGTLTLTPRADRAQLKDFLGRDDVRQALVSQGVDPAEAAARVDSLSDSEVLQIQKHIEALPAGAGFLGWVIAILIIVVLIIVIAKLV